MSKITKEFPAWLKIILLVVASIFVAIAAVLAGGFVTSYLESVFGMLDTVKKVSGMIGEIAAFLFFGGAVIVLGLIEKKTLTDFVANWMLVHKIAPVYFISGVLIVFFSVIIGSFIFTGVLKFYGTWNWLLLLVIVGAFFKVSGEEILFRGYLFWGIRNKLGNVLIAIILSSLTFGILHYCSKGFDSKFMNVAFATYAGFVFAWAYHVSRSLWLPIGLHASWNTLLNQILPPELVKLPFVNFSILSICLLILMIVFLIGRRKFSEQN